MFNKVKTKEASISIEISLSVLLASAVLILALGLFSESLKAMALNTNMTKFFQNNNARAKTANTFIDNNPTAKRVEVAQIPQGQNVQIVADQGLSGAHNAAQRAIAQYASITTPLTQAQLTNLALQLTILGVSGTDDPYTELGKTFTSNGQTMSYLDLADKYKIGINYFQFETTVNKTTTYNWQTTDAADTIINDYRTDGNKPSSGDQNRLANIDVIKSKFN